MTFSLPPVRVMMNHNLKKASIEKHMIEQKNGEYFYRHSEKTATIPCKVIKEDVSFDTLIQSFSDHSVVVILDKNDLPLGFITTQQMVGFLHNAYKQLEAFYETVIQTTDSSITVIDETARVRTWTEGAEKIFSVTKQEIIGQHISDFFDPNKLEILQTLYKGKKITGQYHQPRSGLFVLINSNPIYFNNRIIGAVVSETDVTNQVVLNEKLFNMSTEVHRLEQEVAKYKDSSDPFHSIKGNSPTIQKTIHLARKVCSVKSTVLILGESGVGKEVFAKAIHDASEEPKAPFISINCGAIPASLFESELFGYERGAFSGADVKGKRGKSN